jgi:hypothetical protein
MSQNVGYWIQTIVLVITLIALIKYTYETYRMRQESEKQLELSTRPFVIISPSSQAGQYELKNLGNSPALNVKIDDINVDGILNYFFSETKVIPSNAACPIRDISIKVPADELSVLKVDMGHLVIHSNNRILRFHIHYYNLLGSHYITSEQLSQEVFHFEATKKITSQKDKRKA